VKVHIGLKFESCDNDKFKELTLPQRMEFYVPWMIIIEELRSVKVHQDVNQPPFDWNGIKILPDEIPPLLKFEGDYKDLLLRCQSESFETDIRRLKKNKPLKSDSTVLSLTPTMGEDGLHRLGGRNCRAEFRPSTTFIHH